MERRGWIVAAALGALVAAPVLARAHTRLAPADEYFGRAKMSPLEITNRIRDAQRGRAGYDGLASTQSAIEDWTRKYPSDPWIPSREYDMSHLFARLHSARGDAEASHCRAFLRAHFAGSRYAVAAQRDAAPHRSETHRKAEVAKTRRTTPANAPAKAPAKTPAKKRHRFLGILF